MFNLKPLNAYIYNHAAGRYVLHPVLSGEYYLMAPDVNRVFIAGSDKTGNFLSGSVISSDDAALVGERLEAMHDGSVVSSPMASSVASAYLAKARFTGKKARITVPPHCGLELWDVVSIVDMNGDISADYRVASYILKYSPAESHFYHEIGLCAP